MYGASDRQIRNYRRPMQTRLPQELPQNAGVPFGPCGIEEAKQFQVYLAEYQINIVSSDAPSVCESLIRCTKCQKTVRRCKQLPEKHRCGLTKCWICGKYVQLEGHRYFIQPETKKKKKLVSEEEEEVPENGYDVTAFFDTNVDKANENLRMNQLKNRCRNCYFSTLNANKKMGTTSPIYALYRARLARNGFSKAVRPEMSFVNGCSRRNTQDVRSWPITSKATTAISSCNIYVSKASSTMLSCAVRKS